MATLSSRFEHDSESPWGGPAGSRLGEYPRPSPRGGVAARVMASLVLVAGLWVAISPRFLTLAQGGTNAAIDVGVGLAVVVIGTLALASRRVFYGPQFSGLVLGVLAVLITAFALDFSVSVAAPWYWSNTWSGAVVAVLALAELDALRAPAR